MQQEKLTKVSKSHSINTARMIVLRSQLEQELRGYRSNSPTAYIRIKREFGLTGSRKSVLRQFTTMIEARNGQNT